MQRCTQGHLLVAVAQTVVAAAVPAKAALHPRAAQLAAVPKLQNERPIAISQLLWIAKTGGIDRQANTLSERACLTAVRNIMLGIASARGISSALPAMARAVGTAAADAATAAGSICDSNCQTDRS